MLQRCQRWEALADSLVLLKSEYSSFTQVMEVNLLASSKLF
jgi:hypothetical protein